MTATPETLTPPGQHTLLKLQAPIDAFSSFIDQQLQRLFPVRPMLVWTLHLLVALVLTVLIAWSAGWLCRRFGRMAARRGHKLAASLLEVAAPTLRWMVLLAGIADAIEDAWPQVKGPIRWVSGTLFVLSAIVATRGGVRLLRLILDWVLRPSITQAAGSSEKPTDSSAHATAHLVSATALMPLVQRLAAILVWLIGLILVLDHFGQNVSSVVAAFGVTSLAIGLAAQQALSNIIAGLVLAVDHPFRPGDRIKLPSGDTGEVIETGMRATHIRLGDGSLLVVPNAELVSSRLVNQSTDTLVRAEVRVTALTTLDIERLSREILEDSASATEPEPLPLPPRVYLLTVAPDKVELSLILWLPRGVDVASIEESLRRSALKRLQALLPPPTAATTPPATPSPPAPSSPAPNPGPTSGPRG
jgi:small-conductance mechanosensitive channel